MEGTPHSTHQFRKAKLIIIVVTLLSTSGCAAMPPVQLGQTAGTILGAAIAPGIGPPLGALAGLLTGMLVQGQIDRATEKGERQTLAEQLGSSSPSVTPEAPPAPQGQPIRVWVDETLRDGRLMAGHFEVRYIP